MSQIKIMDMVLANMIAAGEVVERPSSVVKELMENAIDAKANKIIVEVNNIGLESIIVTDNGAGMNKNDLTKSFLRHATSKVLIKSDLERIKTLGFRGEALAAIASVSKLTINSKTKDDVGNFIEIINSKIINDGVVAINKGTKVIVRDLFYNTPARFKYLKSEIAEKNSIIYIFEKIALSNPHISFQLIIDNKEIKHTLGNNKIPSVLEQIYGNVAKGLKHLETSISKVKVDAYLINPEYTKTRKTDINIFINNRYIRNYMLEQAFIDGYNTFIMTNRYPMGLIYLTIDPTLVDVNIHPRKTEVKLANEMLISYQLTTLIKKKLEEGKLPFKEPIKINTPDYKIEQFDLFSVANMLQEEGPTNDEIVSPKIPKLEYIGTLLGTYLIFQDNYGMYLVDQHAAAERVRYEYYEHKIGNLTNEYYDLIVPYDLNLDTTSINTLKHHNKKLKEIGFIFNENYLIAHPVWLRDLEIETSINSIINQLEKYETIDLTKLRNDLAKDIACKSAIKANHQLSLIEINHLMEQLNETKNPYTCPHGRPTLIKLSNYDIEKMFKRIV